MHFSLDLFNIIVTTNNFISYFCLISISRLTDVTMFMVCVTVVVAHDSVVDGVDDVDDADDEDDADDVDDVDGVDNVDDVDNIIYVDAVDDVDNMDDVNDVNDVDDVDDVDDVNDVDDVDDVNNDNVVNSFKAKYQRDTLQCNQANVFSLTPTHDVVGDDIFDVDICVHGNGISHGRCSNQHQNIVLLQQARFFT